MAFTEPVLTKRIPLDPAQRHPVWYDEYVATRGYAALKRALEMKPDLLPEEIARLPKNIITRALGMKDAVKVDIRSERAEPGGTLAPWTGAAGPLHCMLRGADTVPLPEARMQYFFFHLMSWPYLPADFDRRYDSAWHVS